MPGVDAISKLIAAGEIRRASLPVQPVDAISGQDTFASLLNRARVGDLQSGLPVSIDPAVSLGLTSDQLERVSQAVDRLTAAGSDRALVEIDGAWLKVDVERRTIVGVAELVADVPVAGIDTVVRAPDGGAGSPGVTGLTGTGASNLNELLGALATGLVR